MKVIGKTIDVLLGMMLVATAFAIGGVVCVSAETTDLYIYNMADIEASCTYDETTRTYYCEATNIYIVGNVVLPQDDFNSRNIIFIITNNFTVDTEVAVSASCTSGGCTAGNITINAASIDNFGTIKTEAYCTGKYCNRGKTMRSGIVNIFSSYLNNMGTINAQAYCSGGYCSFDGRIYAGDVTINSPYLNNLGTINSQAYCSDHYCNSQSGIIYAGTIFINSTSLDTGTINAQAWCSGSRCNIWASRIYAGTIKVDTETATLTNVSILANAFDIGYSGYIRQGGTIEFTIAGSFAPVGVFDATGESANGTIILNFDLGTLDSKGWWATHNATIDPIPFFADEMTVDVGKPCGCDLTTQDCTVYKIQCNTYEHAFSNLNITAGAIIHPKPSLNIVNNLTIEKGSKITSECSFGGCTAGNMVINATRIDNFGEITAEAYCKHEGPQERPLFCNQEKELRGGAIDIISSILNNWGTISSEVYCSGRWCSYRGSMYAGDIFINSTSLNNAGKISSQTYCSYASCSREGGIYAGAIKINSDSLNSTGTINAQTWCSGLACGPHGETYAGNVSVNTGSLNNTGTLSAQAYCSGYYCNIKANMSAGTILINSTSLDTGTINAQAWCSGWYCNNYGGRIYAGTIKVNTEATTLINVNILANASDIGYSGYIRQGGTIEFTTDVSFVPSGVFDATGESANGRIMVWYGLTEEDYCDISQATVTPPATFYWMWWSMTESYIGCVGADSDGDGILDVDDACPLEDATGADANTDGCIDTAEDMPVLIEELALPQGIETALISMVNNAIKSLGKGNDKAAINQLNAFINAVEAQRGKKISEQDADTLVEYTNNVIAQIAR